RRGPRKSRGARERPPPSDATGVDQRRDACRSAAALEAVVERAGAGIETGLGLGRAGLLAVETGETDRLRAGQLCGRVRVEVARRLDGAGLVGGRPIVQAALRLVDVGLLDTADNPVVRVHGGATGVPYRLGSGLAVRRVSHLAARLVGKALVHAAAAGVAEAGPELGLIRVLSLNLCRRKRVLQRPSRRAHAEALGGGEGAGLLCPEGDGWQSQQGGGSNREASGHV